MYARPVDFTEALKLLAEPDTRVLAGGTDIFPAAGERPLNGRYVDVTALPALHTLALEDDFYRVGAAVTWSDLAAAELPPAFAALRAAARDVGGVQIQNRATIAGNLCNASPAADGVPPLLVLDAEVELASLRGRRRLPLNAFITGNRRTAIGEDEIMTAILVPRPPATTRSSFLKLGARRYLVISIVMVAVHLEIVEGRVQEARIAAGSCSAVAARLPEAERRLLGLPADESLGGRVEAGDLVALSPIDDLRGTAEYRRDAALTLVRRAVDLCVAGQAGGVI